MELTLIRREAKKDRTLGELYIGKEKVCDTLEPTYRSFGEKPGVIKVPGKTAIPAGRYAVRVTPSPKFKGKWLPVLCRVPGFSGIRIHAGNGPADTAGCILVGTRPKGSDGLVKSRVATDLVAARLLSAQDAGQLIKLEIINAFDQSINK